MRPYFRLIRQKRGKFPFDPRRWPFFYGWMILVWGTIGMLMSIPGQTIGVSAFTESLLSALEISRDKLSLAYMFGTIASSFLLPVVGKYYDRIGVRPIAFGAAVLLGCVLIYLSQLDRVVDFLFGGDHIWIFTVILAFLGFFLLRFFGQGVLTMVSRNMMMMWFEKRRGFATGFSNVFVSLGFSFAPYAISLIIASQGWRGAWQILAVVVGILFPVIVIVFFRNSPFEVGMEPDGDYELSERQKKSYFPVVKQFNLSETIRTFSFWVFTLFLAMQGLYITGFTFHVVSLFDEVGLSEETALSIFQPMAIISVITTLSVSTLSDYIRLKYLLHLKGLGGCCSALGVILLGHWEGAYYVLFIGTGVMAGLFSVLNSVTWPRYYGTRFLGAITGQSIMFIVFGSALGPILFSLSLTHSGSYAIAGWISFSLFFLLFIGSFWADNPQERLR